MPPRMVVIPAGESQSAPFPVPEDTKIAGVWIPAEFTPSKISFRYSPGFGEGVRAVHDTTNTELVIDASTHGQFSPTVYLLGETVAAGGFDVRLVSGDENAETAQAEEVICYILWGT